MTEHGENESDASVFEPRRLVSLLIALLFVLAIRLIPFPAVYRGDDVVLSSNDPYFYRYWVESLSASAASVLDPTLFSDLPGAIAYGEPLTIVSLSFLATLAGGGAAGGTILAWYPVVSALVTGALVYLLTLRITDDERMALAAVGLFAVIPGHALRTGLGFADHHAFDYPWLALTALGLVYVFTREADERPWPGVGAIAAGVTGQTLAWEAGPLLVLPAGLAVAVGAVIDCHAGRDPVARLWPVVAGFVGATVLVLAAHLGLGWQTRVVASAPALLLLGTLGVLVVAEIVNRFDAPAWSFASVQVVALGVGLVVLPVLLPDLSQGLDRGVAFLFGDLAVGETVSLVAGFGPVVGPLVMLGFTPILGIPVMAWALARSYEQEEPRWAVLSVYAWYFLGLAFVQRRFAGEVAPFLAVFAGIGFVYLVSWLDLVDPPAPSSDDPIHAVRSPDRVRLGLLGGVGLALTGFPGGFTAWIHDQVKIDPRKYRAAKWMRSYADEHDWPMGDRYVFSEWGRNRVYNYFVSGDSRSYRYAKQNYGEFLFSSEAEAWYEELRDTVQFVVVHRVPGDLSGFRLYTRLHDTLGSASDRVRGLGHYRARYASADGEVVVFTLVPGATLTGEASADSELLVETQFPLAVPRGEGVTTVEREYRRWVSPESDGSFSVTVAHAGEYAVRNADGERLGVVSVPESAVTNGERIDASGVT